MPLDFIYWSNRGWNGNSLFKISSVQKGWIRNCSQEILYRGSFSKHQNRRSWKQSENPGILDIYVFWTSWINAVSQLLEKGCLPVAISYKRHPKAQISEAKLKTPTSVSSSGDMQFGFVFLSLLFPSFSKSCNLIAHPKSPSFNIPNSFKSTFSDFKSTQIIEWLCK